MPTVAIERHLDQLGLPYSDYGEIVMRLGREPNTLELGLFGTMWSEHSSYRSSKLLLEKYFDELNERLEVMSDSSTDRNERLVEKAREKGEASDPPGLVPIGGQPLRDKEGEATRDMWRRYEEAIKNGTALLPPNQGVRVIILPQNDNKKGREV